MEWIGERRSHQGGAIRESKSPSRGNSRLFDLAVSAAGYGIERNANSYWRSETVRQPLLNRPRRACLISGRDDGALIDLVRARLSRYRQGRISEEAFSGRKEVLKRLSDAKRETSANPSTSPFKSFDAVFSGETDCRSESGEILNLISGRLRRDTDAILKIKVHGIASLLRGNGRISFQNALSTCLLYRVGGFSPSKCEEREIAKKALDTG